MFQNHSDESLQFAIKDIQEALKNAVDMAVSGSGSVQNVQKYTSQLTAALMERDTREHKKTIERLAREEKASKFFKEQVGWKLP